jgi:hypothetical protein
MLLYVIIHYMHYVLHTLHHSYSFIYKVYESHEEAVTDVAGVPNIDGMLYLPASS